MPGIRSLDQLISDLDTRQREDARSRNRVITRYGSIQDTVGLSSDTIITTVTTAGDHWGNLAGSTSRTVIASGSIVTAGPTGVWS